MDVSTRDKIVRNIRYLMDSFAAELPSENITDSQGLLDHAEWGEAFDLICTQVYEFEVALTHEQYDVVDQTGRMMGLAPTSWDYLKELVG